MSDDPFTRGLRKTGDSELRLSLAVIISLITFAVVGISIVANLHSYAIDIASGGVRYATVKFGETAYNLPVDKFMFTIHPGDKNEDAWFTFKAILPDMLPVSDDFVEAETWENGTGWHRMMIGLVHYGSTPVTGEKILENVERYGHWNFHDFIAMPNGCKKYETPTAQYHNILQV
jgi:hypothetical protein